MRLKFETAKRLGDEAVLGLVVLQNDETVEREFRQLATAEGCTLYHTRVQCGPEVTPDALAQMEANIPAAAGLLPRAANFDVIGYACTSGATIIGERRVGELIRSVHPGVATSDPLTAVKAALRTLKVRRLGFVTPYVGEVSLAMRQSIEGDDVQIAAFGSFEQSKEEVVARITPTSILDAVIDIGGTSDCDGVFVSCTNLRTQEILTEAEDRLNKPVISSNQALAWHMMGLAGLTVRSAGRGCLFDYALP